MTAQRGAAGREEPTPAALRARSVQGLQEQFPGVRVWYGQATGSWWALVPARGGPRLVEAAAPEGLRAAIISARSAG